MRQKRKNIWDAQGSGKEEDGGMSEQFEKILCDENIRLARKRVCQNKVQTESMESQSKN